MILAGVTIATLTGDNGILSQVQNAKTSSEIAEIEEQIKLAVTYSRMNEKNDLSIDTAMLEDELEKNGITVKSKGTEDKLPWIVTRSGYMFQIKADGTVERASGISLNATSVKLMQGETKTITATLSEGINGTIAWESSDTSVVTVENGTITAVGASGTATITASITSGGKTYEASCEVTILQKVTSITTSSTLTVEIGSSSQITVTTEPATNVEDLTYTSSDEDIATVDESGNVTGVAEGTATITVAGSISTGVTATCAVTVTKPVPPIGDYVQYDVSYVDMYSDTDLNTDELQPYTFTKVDGWRILDAGTKNADGTYSGTKIISTGIPGILDHTCWTNVTKENNGWWGTVDEVNSEFGLSLTAYSYTQAGYYAVYGLRHNFTSIPFLKIGTITGLTSNNVCYTDITNAEATNTATGEIFKTSKASEVHNLTMKELNKSRNDLTGSNRADNNTTDATPENDPKSLFYLVGLNDYGYSTSVEPYYWLADIQAEYEIRQVYPDGKFAVIRTGSSGDGQSGIRPVITLNSPIYKDGDIWKIK